MGMLGQDANDDKKPLFRKWLSNQKKLKSGKQTIAIESIRLSASEEWILIETEECVGLLSALSSVGQEFWNNLQEFEGQGIGLKLIPSKGKIGFDVEFNEGKKVYYIWDENTLNLSTTKKLKSTSGTSLSTLTWETSQKLLEESSRKTSKTTTNKTQPSSTGENDSLEK